MRGIERRGLPGPIVVAALVLLGATPAAKPVDVPCPFEAMYEQETKTLWYWPRGFDWRPETISIYPLLGRHEDGRRSVALRVTLKDPSRADRESLLLLIDEEPLTLSFDHGEASGKNNAFCRTLISFSLPSQQDLVRRIARANRVIVGAGTKKRFALSSRDLEGFRDIARLMDAAELPDPPPPPPTEMEFKTPPGWTAPESILASKVAPQYPPFARRLKMSAKVVLQAIVRKSGDVDQVEVMAPSGAECGFEESAIEAVKNWRYRPATCNGEPVDVPLKIVVSFEMAN